MDTEAAAKPAAAAGGGAAPKKPRRKLGQKPGGDHPKLARELPKKSGYLLKKGPLKVREPATAQSPARSPSRNSRGPVCASRTHHVPAGVAKTMVRFGGGRALVLPLAHAGTPQLPPAPR